VTELRAILLIAAHRASGPARTYEMVRAVRAAKGGIISDAEVVSELIAMRDEGILDRTIVSRDGHADWYWAERRAA